MIPSLITPWTIHEADLALYAAWQDGMPMTGPGGGRGSQIPVFEAKASLTIERTAINAPPTGMDWQARQNPHDSAYSLSVEFPDGLSSDATGVLMRAPVSGQYVMVVRFLDQSRHAWSKLQFFHVTVDADSLSESGQMMRRSLRMHSTWLDDDAGPLPVPGIPSLLPEVTGLVEWVCGSLRVPALRYDPVMDTWTSTIHNLTGDGTHYVTLAPVSSTIPDLCLAYYQPRALAVPGDFGGTLEKLWQNAVVFRIGGASSAWHHGLALSGLNVQTGGVPEPLLMLPQSREWDEPVLVFRYLRRVLAVVGHGVLAVPSLSENTPFPSFPPDPGFRFLPAGGGGLCIYPSGAYLDGTVFPSLAGGDPVPGTPPPLIPPG